MDAEFHSLSATEVKNFDRLFQEAAGENGEEIAYEDFKEIVLSYNKFNKNVSINILDKIKKKLKEGMSSQQEQELFLCM
jgi:hypothetical protein